MTDDQVENIFKSNIGDDLRCALRGVWNAGYYEGAAITPSAASPDKSLTAAKPVAVLVVKKK